MRRLGTTVARLTAMRRAGLASMAQGDGRLSRLTGFGANPGALDAKIYLPDNLPSGAPLVVVLHGCTQNAGVYDKGSGWSTLADRHGFALLFPEQSRANNSNLCFNWYAAADARRGKGEARSIARMIEHMTAEHDLNAAAVYDHSPPAIDPGEIFVVQRLKAGLPDHSSRLEVREGRLLELAIGHLADAAHNVGCNLCPRIGPNRHDFDTHRPALNRRNRSRSDICKE